MKRGSITVYVSLVLLMLLSLIAAGFSTARQAAARVVIASAAEQALFSAFGKYNRELFEEYGLLFIDGSFGTGSFNGAALLHDIEEDAKAAMEPGLLSLSGRDPVGARLAPSGNCITGYVTATDDGGRAFTRQVCEIMQNRLGPAGLLFLQTRLDTEQAAAQSQEDAAREWTSAAADVTVPDTPPRDENGAGPVIPENFFDPLAAARRLRSIGLIPLVFPRAEAVSAASVEKHDLPSGRELNRGMNIPADGWKGSGEKLLMLEYIAEMFPCYTSGYQEAGLKYQVEYAIAGGGSDRENLADTLVRLQQLREAANFLHILRSPDMRSQAERVAGIISSIILNPELQPAIAVAVEFAWAYGESIVDLQKLISGGKVPLIKDAASWELPLAELPFLRFRAPAEGGAEGIDYSEYLRILLFMKSSGSLTSAAMDLVEMNMRGRAGQSTFRLDSHIDALRAELHASAGKHEYRIERSYGYDA